MVCWQIGRIQLEDYIIQMINIINQQSLINQELVKYPTAALNLCILGTQASGKSTILNELFKTEFPVLDSSKERRRCTRGVWLQNINNMNIIDTEGFDSEERTDDEKLFQKQMSLFCVAISDVVLVNVYMNEIGRYSGSHVDVLQAILTVGQRLVTPQQKKLIYVVRDCTQDADRHILQEQLSRQIKTLSEKFKNKILKFSTQYYFMSHFVYDNESFMRQSKQLLPLLSIKRPSSINNYKEEDRIRYIKQLWRMIKDTETSIDLKSLDDAIKSHVMERLKKETLQLLQKQLQSLTNLNQVKSFQKYIAILKQASLNYISQNRPRNIKEKELQTENAKIFEAFQSSAVKHFNNVALKNIENDLEQKLNSEIEKNKSNKKFSHLIFKKKKQITDLYKRIINNHKQYSLLLRNFNEKISQIMSKQERNLNHLFSIFQTAAESQLNKLISEQANNLSFKKQQFNQKIKAICQQYQYNEWQVDFKQMWEKVSYRCIQKIIPQVIEEKSLKSIKDVGSFSGDQTTNIIAFHTKLQKKAVQFCRDIIGYLHQEQTITQPLSQIKQVVRQCLNKRLIGEQRRWKISFLLIAVFLFILYGQLQTLLGWTMKKKKKKLYMRIYFWSSILFLSYSIFRQFFQKKNEAKHDSVIQ